MKQKRLLILFVAVAVLAVGLGVFFYGRYEVINHAKHMSKSELLAYNSAMTARGHTAGWITQDMVLVLNDLHKDRQTDAEAEFYIYQLSQGADPDDFLRLYAGKIQEGDGVVLMGMVTCRIPGDQLLSAYDCQVNFIR